MKRTSKLFSYLLFNKPYGVLSQFTSREKIPTLAKFGPFPPSVYPVGRLDVDSEGLLLLTDDNLVKHRLSDPDFDHPKTYLVQVERIPSVDAINELRNGIILQGEKTKPAEVSLLEKEPTLPPRPVPIRFRKNVPTAWLEITLREGRNRQVRRMTAAVGHPTLRLIRVKIGDLSVSGLQPGESRPLNKQELRRLFEQLDLRGQNKNPDALIVRRGQGGCYET